mgnify:CR=1 FL=1
MKQYICSICGYVFDEAKDGKWENLPDDWKCPICGAGKDAFRTKEKPVATTAPVETPHLEKELSAMEMSIICSNLARGCEKQYLPEAAENFTKLAAFFRSKAESVQDISTEKLLELVEKDLTSGFPYGFTAASEQPDRGALRALTWSEKVTRMQESLLARYKAEGEKMLNSTGVYVCSVCGFIFIADAPPEICPVCKVPAWKFEKAERRAK